MGSPIGGLNRGPGGLAIRAAGPMGAVRVLELRPPAAPTPSPVQPVRRGRARLILSRLVLALGVLQIFDLASTLMLLSIGGTEVNPVSAWLLSMGVEAFVAAKVGLAVALFALVPWLRRDRRQDGVRTAVWTCAGFDIVYALAVASNLLQFAVFA